MKKERYIEMAKALHGDKYNYSLLPDEVQLKGKIRVICPVHGEVEITADNHIHNGSGCKLCGFEKTKSKIKDSVNEFIEKEKRVHGDKYEVIRESFESTYRPVRFFCKQCGNVFTQKGDAHLQGCGCNICNPPHTKLTTDTFKEKLSKTHPNLEVLSEYMGTNKPITVRCKIHDYTYTTTPHRLVGGANCQKCYDDRRGLTLLKKPDEVMANIIKKHGNKYRYPHFYEEYENNRSKITIVCPENHEFQMSVNKHLAGQGCDKCADVINGLKKRLPIEVVLERANKSHNGKYSYPNLKEEFKGNNSLITIICPIHGEFKQLAGIHTNGSGCPQCNESHLERRVAELFPEAKRWAHPKWLGRQSYDFLLEDKNMAIECQGGQHFFPTEGFGGEEGFKLGLERDIRKYNLSKKHNIKLIYITNKSFSSYLSKPELNGIYSKNTYFIEDLEENKGMIEKILG